MSKVKFQSNLAAVQAEASKRLTQHFETTDFPAKCPSCSKEIAICDGMNTCPSCKSGINLDLKIDKV